MRIIGIPTDARKAFLLGLDLGTFLERVKILQEQAVVLGMAKQINPTKEDGNETNL